MNKLLFTLTSSLLLAAAYGQTNVGGGIYTNTTWTQANSPYIVVDTIVVFPGYQLTIEPGVVVKFENNMYIEIRNATLIANGTMTDSITFTSNSLLPTPGIYRGISINNNSFASFNFVNVKYAINGIYNVYSQISYIKNSTFTYNLIGLEVVDNTPVDSCTFKFNGTGLDYLASCSLNSCTISNNTKGIEGPFAGTLINNCTIDSNQIGIDVSSCTIINCTISYNQTGVSGGGNNTLKNCIVDHNSIRGLNLVGAGHNTDSVINCEIMFNGIGITSATCGGSIVPDGAITQCTIEGNATGLQLGGCCEVYCNSFCNNTSFDFENLYSYPRSVPNNYWCTSDSAIVEASIYDGYDNTNLGLVTFMPMDSLLLCSPLITSTIDEIYEENVFQLFPNPATNFFTIKYPSSNLPSLLQIINPIGEIVYVENLSGKNEYMVKINFAKGIYYVKVNDAMRKLIVD